MLSKVLSAAVLGLQADLVEVEVDVGRGNAHFFLVGLPDAAVRESEDRVRSAMRNSGFRFPFEGRVTVNLAPANLRKEGPSYDLPIALGILIASNQLMQESLADSLVMGELSLDGSVRHVRGILPMADMARNMGIERVFVPAMDAREAALIPGLEVYAVNSLGELVEQLEGMGELTPYKAPSDDEVMEQRAAVDFSEIKGQEHAKRALEVSAAGAHNLMMVGPPGAGKTLMARALPGILPKLSLEEALEVTRIYSVADALPADVSLMQLRPFRAPHHTISNAGLVGGGQWPRPGEISLAHRGVLFLDEMPEFNRKVLEVLRQPMEDKIVTISRAQGSLTFPANFMMIGSMNPCPCGYYGDTERECTCSTGMIQRYRQRLSGPLLDRIDIHMQVPRVSYEKLTSLKAGESSESIRNRVEAARQRQRARLEETGKMANADMGPAEIRMYCQPSADGEKLLRTAMRQMQLSARGYHRILKVARTIADLEGANTIQTHHLAEALQYRTRVLDL